MKVDEELDVVEAVEGDKFELLSNIDEEESKESIGNGVEQNKLLEVAVRKFQQPHRKRHIGSDTPRQLVLEKRLALVEKLPPIPLVTIPMIEYLKNNNKNARHRISFKPPLAEKQ
ncbi:hypothetical protein [Neobacillus mesonae]|uniref:hypothetical protein n=1 Tax=Neobacillus mesonae TaxID=1193713 RepID=UPI00399C9D35